MKFKIIDNGEKDDRGITHYTSNEKLEVLVNEFIKDKKIISLRHQSYLVPGIGHKQIVTILY